MPNGTFDIDVNASVDLFQWIPKYRKGGGSQETSLELSDNHPKEGEDRFWRKCSLLIMGLPNEQNILLDNDDLCPKI